MPKKPISSTQVRLEQEVANDVRVLWTLCETRTSLTAFTNMLIKRGISSFHQAKVFYAPLTDSGESSFKK